MLERLCGASRSPAIDDTATIIFSSGSTGEPKGVVLSHFNIDSNVEAIGQVYRVLPTDRLIGILPFFHSFGYTMFWFAANIGHGDDLSSQPARRRRDRLAGRAVSRHGAAGHADLPAALPAPLHAGPVRLAPPGPGRRREAARVAGTVVRRHVRHPADGRLRPDRVLAGRRREHVRLARARLFSTRLSPRLRRPAVARRARAHRVERDVRAARARRSRASSWSRGRT